MTRDETRGKVDLSLPIEGVEQSDTDLLSIGGQVSKRLAAIDRNARRRHIVIASEVKRHRSVQDTTHRLAVALPIGSSDSLQYPVGGIGIGEDVIGRLPISVLVGAPEACQPERRRIGERTAEVRRG